MTTRILTLLLFAVPISAGCSSPPGRYQGAVIYTQGALPCFGVERSDEANRSPPTIANIRVTEAASSGALLIWEVNYSPKETARTLRGQECITFGLGGSSTAQLREGVPYSVSLLGDINGRSGEPEVRRYSANFCMVQKGDVLQPQQVNFDKARGTWAWETCGFKVKP